jgi:hypothetical protein
MIINAPTTKVSTYDVAGQTDVQFNFDFDPTAMRADGTTLIVEYEGNEIRLENFFDADGNSLVENFLTQDGQTFSAAEFLAAIMGGTEGGNTAEDIETAAGAAAGGSGAGDYSDDAGILFDGLDALGGQGDAYDQQQPEPVEEVPGDTRGSDDNYIDYQGEAVWRRFDNDDYTTVAFYKPKADEQQIADSADLYGHIRTRTEYHGTDGNDVLTMPDIYGVGSVLLLEDDSPGAPWSNSDGTDARISGIEEIRGSSFDDIIDLSSTTMDYTDGNGNIMDVKVYGNDGDDVIWTNSGNDYIDGGAGSDNLIGGVGDDTILGGTGDDIIKGSDGADLLNGGDGDDNVYGGTGEDVMYGDAGNDYLHGGAGNDQIFGGDGNDTINPGTNDPGLNGSGSGIAYDEVTLGDGHDTLLINSSSLTPDDPILDPSSTDWSIVEVSDFVDGEDQIQLDGCFYTNLYFRNDTDGTVDPALVFTANADGSGASTIVVLDNWTVTDFYNSQLYIDLTT